MKSKLEFRSESDYWEYISHYSTIHFLSGLFAKEYVYKEFIPDNIKLAKNYSIELLKQLKNE